MEEKAEGAYGALQSDLGTIASLLSRSMELRCQLGKMFYMLLRDYYKARKVHVT